MNQKDIKAKMTQGVFRGKDTEYSPEVPFTVSPEDGTTPWVACERKIFANDVLLGSLWMQTASGGYETPRTVEEISADHSAIVSAVNNTYGIGIDPTKVGEMAKMLSTVLGYEGHISELHKDIEQLLNSAKL